MLNSITILIIVGRVATKETRAIQKPDEIEIEITHISLPILPIYFSLITNFKITQQN